MKRIIVLLGAVTVAGKLFHPHHLTPGERKSMHDGRVVDPYPRNHAPLTAAQVTPPVKGAKPGASGTFKATLTGTTLKWEPDAQEPHARACGRRAHPPRRTRKERNCAHRALRAAPLQVTDERYRQLRNR